MTKLKLTFILWLCMPFLGFSQVYHWESIITPAEQWKYQVPTTQPDYNWTQLGYYDGNWAQGSSGFGYGDNDDNTIVPAGTRTLYLRKTFNVVDNQAVSAMTLSLDYDDSFVAYLNGVEIARNLVSGYPPRFDQFSDGLHEAALYQGLVPDAFEINPSMLNNGQNILAIEVHNESVTSSDLSAMAVLSVGINNNSSYYQPTPSWFEGATSLATTLPLVVVDTYGQGIPDDPKVRAHLGIINNGEGQLNHINDPFNEYSGIIGIEQRGESSFDFPKKSYAIEMWDDAGEDIDTSFLDFPEEEDFILYGPYADKSLMNNMLAMKMARSMGHYASRTQFVELILNDEYKGIYIIMEKMKRGGDRIDISKLKEDDIAGDDLTGGYIFRIDKGNDPGWSSNYNAYQGNHRIFFQYFYPEAEDIQYQQQQYIQQYVSDFEEAIASGSHYNSKGKHYMDYIDVDAFIDNFIVNELTKNVDAYRLSTYFYKDKESKGGKLKCGYWDFNLSFGNADYCAGDNPTGWIYYQCPGNSPFWWHNMLQDPQFTSALKCRWQYLRQTILSTAAVDSYVNGFANELTGADTRNFDQWPVLGVYTWPNPWLYIQPNSYEGVLNALRGWLHSRLDWMDANMPGTANGCSVLTASAKSAIKEIPNDEGVKVYPNPALNNVTISSEILIKEIQIRDVTGKVLLNAYPEVYEQTISLEAFTSGVYIINLMTDHGVITQKLQIQK